LSIEDEMRVKSRACPRLNFSCMDP
jgi:hypothetical protein